MSKQNVTPNNRAVAKADQDKIPEREVPVYLRILSPALLRVIAIISFTMALMLTLLGIFNPLRFENEIARVMLCLAVATTLAVFFFIFYPERIEMNLPVAIGTTLRLAGPVALWLGVFLFLLQYMPSPEYGRVFEIWRDGRPGGMYLGDKDTTYLKVKEGKPPDHMLIGANDGSRDLFGIYVLFPRNVRRVEGVLHHDVWLEDFPVMLTRDGDAIIDITLVKERKLK